MDAAARQSTRERARQQAQAATYRLGSPDRERTLVGWLNGHGGDADEDAGLAKVRDSDDSIEVLLMRRDEHGQLFLPEHIADWDGHPVPTEGYDPPTWSEARAIAGCAIRLTADAGHDGQLLDELQRSFFFDSWQRSPLLAGQLVLPIDRSETYIAGWTFSYDIDTGLSVDRDWST